MNESLSALFQFWSFILDDDAQKLVFESLTETDKSNESSKIKIINKHYYNYPFIDSSS